MEDKRSSKNIFFCICCRKNPLLPDFANQINTDDRVIQIMCIDCLVLVKSRLFLSPKINNSYQNTQEEKNEEPPTKRRRCNEGWGKTPKRKNKIM